MTSASIGKLLTFCHFDIGGCEARMIDLFRSFDPSLILLSLKADIRLMLPDLRKLWNIRVNSCNQLVVK